MQRPRQRPHEAHRSLPPVGIDVADVHRRRAVLEHDEIDARRSQERDRRYTPIATSLRALGPLVFHQIRRTPDEALFNSLLAQYHYLGYQQPVGEHLKYLVVAGDRPVACFAWGSTPGALGIRDRFIGWSAEARRRHLRLLAANTRFLILPWVQVPHLASHLLARMAARLSADWQQVYHHPIVWLETFIDPARFRGTCYRAANWIVLGRTSGRGHRAPTKQPTRPIKEVLGYPLVADFRRRLGEG
ncbi:MAG: DUF4338 domain-containing protein [Acidobacteria bacterium]|nr:DUF4338 domain-containing protein [Acidobacteriota bacterium]